MSVMNNAIINMRLLVSILGPDFISFNRYLEVRLLDNIPVHIFNFLRKFHAAFSNGHSISHPHCQFRRVLFLHTLLAELTIVYLFDDSHSDVCEFPWWLRFDP